MKAFKISIFLIIFVIFFITFHSIFINKAVRVMTRKLDDIEVYVDQEKWQEAHEVCQKLKNDFDKKSFWFHVTLDSCEAREMENSIQKIEKLISKEKCENLYAELALLKQLLSYIPQKEGFDILEIL